MVLLRNCLLTTISQFLGQRVVWRVKWGKATPRPNIHGANHNEATMSMRLSTSPCHFEDVLRTSNIGPDIRGQHAFIGLVNGFLWLPQRLRVGNPF